MRWVGSACVLGASWLLGGCATRSEAQGPLPVRNQHPAQLLVMSMPPASTRTLASGAVAVRGDAAYSSLWLVGGAPGRQWRMDGEYLRAATTARFGLGGGLEAALELPVAHTSGGFLDDFLIDYHDLFGMPDQDRDIAPRDRFDIGLRANGTEVWGVDADGLTLLDAPVTLTWRLTDPKAAVGAAVRGGVELPLGDADRGYGNGGVEPSVGVLVDRVAGAFSFYGHAQYTWAETPDRTAAAGLQFADVAAAGVGAEIAVVDGAHAYVQLAWEQSTLRRFGLAETDDDQALLWIGGRLRCSDDLAVELGFGEDLIALVSPDFTAWVGMVWRPGAWLRPGVPRLPR